MDTTPPSSFDINLTPPHGANKFFLVFKNKFLTHEESEILSKQVMTVLLDLASKKLMMVLEHPGSEDFLNTVVSIACHDVEIELNMMDGQTGGSFDKLEFFVRCTKHEFVLSYKVDDVAKHVLVFEIQ
jgi:hypothetical protein